MAPALREVREEFESAERDLGTITSVVTGGLLVSSACCVVITFYFREAGKVDYLYNAVTVWLFPIITIFVTVPPALLNLHSMICVNRDVGAIARAATALLTDSSGSARAGPAPALHGPGGTAGARRRAAPALASWDRSGGADHPEARGAAPSEPAADRLQRSVDAVQFALLVDRSPCALTMLGRAVTWGEVASSVALLAVAQIINVLGLGRT